MNGRVIVCVFYLPLARAQLAVEQRRHARVERAKLRAAADAAAAAVTASATRAAFVAAGRATALGERLELARRADEHTAQVSPRVRSRKQPSTRYICVSYAMRVSPPMYSYLSLNMVFLQPLLLPHALPRTRTRLAFFSLINVSTISQELERAAQCTRTLGKRDLLDPLRLGKDGCFAAALAAAVAASVAAQSASRAAQAAVDSQNGAAHAPRHAPLHAAHADAHAAAAAKAAAAAVLAAAQALELAASSPQAKVAQALACVQATAKSSGAPPTSPVRVVQQPLRRSSRPAMTSPPGGDDGDDEDFDGGDYVAAWQVQR